MLETFLALIGNLLTPTAHAISGSDFCSLYGEQLAGGCGFGTDFFGILADRVRIMALGFIPGACVIAVIIGGIRIMSSGIDEGGREQGKTIIKFALIGLVLAITVGLIVNFVGDFIMTYVP